jgi:hypothetical protein
MTRRDTCRLCGRVVIFNEVLDDQGAVCAMMPNIHRPGRHAPETVSPAGTMKKIGFMKRDELREYRCDGGKIFRTPKREQ